MANPRQVRQSGLGPILSKEITPGAGANVNPGNHLMSPKIKLCKEAGCNNQQTTAGFCRLHYLKNWKKIQADKKRKAAKNLNKYIESIVRSNPDRASETLKENLRDDLSFERSMEDVFYGDSLREVMADLGYREDIDTLIGSIKVDEDF